MKTERERVLLGVGLLGFLLLVLLQHNYVWLQFDDYGYAVLYYARNQSMRGIDIGLKEILEYLQWHYVNWGGRVLSFFTEILMLRQGLGFTRVVQTLVIWSGLYLSWRIVSEEKKERRGFLLTFLLVNYGLLARKTITDGVFWLTASFVYLWPYVVFLAGIRLDQLYRKKKKTALLAASWFFFFCAGFSQEQTGFAVFVYALLDLALPWLFDGKRTIRWREQGKILFAGLGFAITFLAPGNFVRLEENAEFNSLSFAEKLRVNIPAILQNNFGPYNRFFAIMLAITGILLAFLFWKNLSRRRWKVLCGINITAQSLFLLYVLTRENTWGDRDVCFWLIWCMLFLIQVLVLFYWKKNWMAAGVFLAGLATQGALLISPSISNRTHLVFELTLHLVLAWIWAEALEECNCRILYGMLTLMGCLAVMNLSENLKVYQENSRIHELNHNKLAEVQMNAKAGQEEQEVHLYMLPHDDAVSQMPYQQDFIELYMKEYYELPEELIFTWQEATCRSDMEWEDGRYADNWLGKQTTIVCTEPVDAVMTLRLYNESKEPDGQTVSVQYEDGSREEIPLSPGKNEVEIQLQDGTLRIQLLFDKTIKEETGKQRELSVKYTGMEIRAAQ